VIFPTLLQIDGAVSTLFSVLGLVVYLAIVY